MNRKKFLTFFLFFWIFDIAAQEVKICTQESFLNLDPHLASSYPETQSFNGLVYETVVKYNPKSKTLVPFLIDNWTSFSQDKIYKLVFGKDISFYSSKGDRKYQLDANDFLFSFELYWDKVKSGKVDDPYILKNIQKIELAENQKEVLIHLVKSDPFFMQRLVGKMGIVLSKKYYDELKQKNKLVDFYKNPVGTGAYGVKKFTAKDLELIRKNNYHFGKVEVASIQFVNTPDLIAAEKYLRNGLCDIVPGLDIKDKELQSHHNEGEIALSLNLNPRSGLMRVLKEIPLWEMINLNALARTLNPATQSVGQFVPNGSSLKDKAQINMVYSFTKAQQAIKKYHLKQITIFFTPEVRAEIANMKTFLKYLKESFHELELEITMGDAKTADIVLQATHLNGMNEAPLFAYFDLWPTNGEFTKEWFTGLAKNLGTESYRYPLGFINTSHATRKQISRFYPYHSKNYDLTLLQVSNIN